jgi:hypothetical protein
MSTGNLQPLVFALTASLAGLAYGLYCFFHRWRQQRMVQDTPHARVRSAAQGYVKLGGRASTRSGKPLRAPLSGRACVWWTYSVRPRGRGASSWPDGDRGTSDEPFLLTDEGQHCLVDPQGADVEASQRRVWCGESPRMPTFSIFGYSPFASRNSNRYMEAIIVDDAQLSVLGELRTDSGSVTYSLDDEARARLSEWKADQARLLARFDTNHDGKIDQQEWEQARLAARLEVQKEQLRQAPEMPVNVLRKPADGRPFLIAALSCTQLERTEGRRAIAGLALTLLCLLAACLLMAQLRAHLPG